MIGRSSNLACTRRTGLLCAGTLMLTASAVALALPAGASAAVLAAWGANLQAPNYDTANGYFSNSDTNGNPTPGDVGAVQPGPNHNGDDLAVWNTASSATAPAGGQVLYVTVEGCAWKDPSAPTDSSGAQFSNGVPVNQINFQTLARQANGSYVEDSPPATGFRMPFCSNSNNPSDRSAAVNTSTVTTFQPIHMCIKQGDTVDFYDIGGYIPSTGSYPNGVPFFVIAGDGLANGSTMDSFIHAQNAQNGNAATYSGTNLGIERNEQLMLQVTEGTGDDAYGLCPGGKANEPNLNSNQITCVYDSNPEPGYTDCSRSGLAGSSRSGSGTSSGGVGGNGASPAITLLHLNPPSFFAATGTTITYTDSWAALTTLRVLKLESGIKRGRSCGAIQKRRPRRARKCTRMVAVRVFAHQDKAGGNGIRMSGLGSGSYELEAVAAVDGKASKVAAAHFTVKRRTKHKRRHR